MKYDVRCMIYMYISAHYCFPSEGNFEQYRGLKALRYELLSITKMSLARGSLVYWILRRWEVQQERKYTP